jgi:hypothetical protein
MPSLIGTTVATNYNRVVGPTYTESSQTRTYAGPFSQFGTRDLQFVSVTAVGSDGTTAVNFSTNYLNSNSDYSIALRTLQGFGEVYYATTPNSTGFAVAVSSDTVNSAQTSSNTQATLSGATNNYGAMEAAITSALAKGGTSATTVTGLAATGVTIQ